MPFKLHVISGLPRSGSTLLSAILRQNLRFHAGMTSPVAALLAAMQHEMSGATEFAPFFHDTRRRTILRNVVAGYYADKGDGDVVFDTNRLWTARLPLLLDLYPEARVICCVRDVGWIIDSVERALNKNPLQLSKVLGFKPGNSVYSRAELLMNSENGLVGQAWASLREAWFGEAADRLIVVSYDYLTQQPRQALARLYRELGETPFDHDFTNVEFNENDYDLSIGMPGLHKVRQKVEYVKRDPCIPPDLFAKYNDASFWRRADLNRRGATLLA